MTSGKEDEEFFRQRGFGIKIGFGERPALIIIDMLKGFTDPSMPLGAKLDSEIEAQKPFCTASTAVARTQPEVVQPVMIKVSTRRELSRATRSVPKKHEAYFSPAECRCAACRGAGRP